jgi:hypothetical protein
MLRQKIYKNVVTTLTCLAVLASLVLPGTAEARVKVSDLILQLTAVAADGPQVNLQWNLSDDATVFGYKVERSLDPLSGYSEIYTADRSATSFADQDVVAGQAYYYKVRSYKNSTYSTYSNVAFADIPVDVPQEPVDTAPPSVSLVNPTDNASFTAEQTVNLSAEAIDDIGVDRVDFFCDDILVGSDASAPYSYGWVISQADNGQRSLKAKAYDKTGKEGVSVTKAVSVDIPTAPTAPAEYTAPVLESVQINGSDFVLNWSQPESAYGTPEGGYDVFTDGVDDNLHHTETSAVVSGLQEGVEHCFQVEARWTQATTPLFLASNTICVQSVDNAAPSVSITSPASGASYSSSQTLSIAASAQDNVGVSKVEFYEGSVLKGSDTSAPYSYDWSFSEVDNGTHNFTAKAYDAAGNAASSAAVTVTVDIQSAAAEYTTPVLQSVVDNGGGSFTLNWSLPETSYGEPAGGYDVFTDGVDDNLHHTGYSATVSGLQEGVEHCFQVEARWTQATTPLFLASNTTCVQSVDSAAPSVSITSPTSGASYTSAQSISIAASAQDNVGVSKVEFYEGSVLKGSDTSAPYSYDWSFSEADNGTHSFTAKAYDAAGNVASSAAVSVTIDIQPATAEYTAPAMDYAEASGSDIDLGWHQLESVYGAPEGGYDIFVDGVDTGTTYRTTQQTATISGLSAGEHCFEVEARWTQTVPAVYLKSGQLCAVIEASDPGTDPIPSGPAKVFPGATGFGTDSPAGRGGTILKVTNLNDSGTGSLRAALEANGPRIVVFEISGTINLSSSISINDPYLTVAGQTAPSPGITIEGGLIGIYTHDVLIQHLRLRPGQDAGDNADGLSIRGPSNNVVIDHVSTSWATDENFGPYGTPGGIQNITFSNCISSESLKYGFLVGDLATNISLTGNLLAHNMDRNPLIKAGSSSVILNNLMYNASRWSYMSIGANDSGRGPAYVSAVGNVFVNGPSTDSGVRAIKIESSAPSGTEVYLSDNSYSGTLFTMSSSFDPRISSPPVWEDSLQVRNSSDVEAWVLSNAGARPADRDPVDERIAHEVATRTGAIITDPGQVGGWPNLAVNTRTFNVPANPNGDDDGNGYTNIEEVLYTMARQVEGL